MQQQQLAALIENDYDYTRPRRGEVYEAVILTISEKDIIVDLGVKRDGVVPRKDLESLDDGYVPACRSGIMCRLSSGKNQPVTEGSSSR